MTTSRLYKQALNDILNSKSKDAAKLRKIALKAFTQPIKDIANVTPLNWFQYSDSNWEWFLKVNEVQVACLSNENMDTLGKWVLRDYDTDFADIFGSGSMPEFDSIEEGKHYVGMKFLLWLKDTSEQLLNSEPNPELSVATEDQSGNESLGTKNGNN